MVVLLVTWLPPHRLTPHPPQEEKRLDTDANFIWPHIFDLYAERIAAGLVPATDLFRHCKLTPKKSSDLTT